MSTSDDLKQTSQDFIRQLLQGDFAGAGRLFDAHLAQALPEPKLKETWLQIVGQVGAFQKILAYQAEEIPEKYLVTVTCQFDKLPIDFHMVFNQDGKLSAPNAQPASALLSYNPPAYVRLATFHEVDVTVGSGEWALPATLSLPQGGGPFPAVVLVHGSGPQDRDETLGPNKPFRDLAWGLASQGVAVLRYDKRTFTHKALFTPELIAKGTVKEETIDDALLAVQLLQRNPNIDPRQVFVLGHSLGATLAPLIGQQDPSIAGLIILAGMTRPFEDTILDQYTYIYNLTGSITGQQKAELEELKVKGGAREGPPLVRTCPGERLALEPSSGLLAVPARLPARRTGKIAGNADICPAGWARLPGDCRRRFPRLAGCPGKKNQCHPQALSQVVPPFHGR